MSLRRREKRRRCRRTETGNSHLRASLDTVAEHGGEDRLYEIEEDQLSPTEKRSSKTYESTASHGGGVGEVESLRNVKHKGLRRPDVVRVASLGELAVLLGCVVLHPRSSSAW